MEDLALSGSEIRKDYRTDSYSIIAPKRGSRPKELGEEDINKLDISKCPFERSNDSLTKELAKYGEPWEIKVIENVFPELSGNTPFGEFSAANGLFSSIGGYGYNEVLIDSQNHLDLFEDFSIDKLIEWLGVLIDREEVLYDRKYIKYVQVFKNYGGLGGASLAHPHTQIMAWPILIGTMDAESKIIKKRLKETTKCLYEELRDAEAGRLLVDNGNFFAIAPFGSRISAEAMIIPKRHVSYIGDLSNDEKRDLVSALKSILITNIKLYGKHAYNFTIHELKDDPDFHMHLEIYPRLSTFAGIELGENVFVNTIAPEEYAERFRNTLAVTK